MISKIPMMKARVIGLRLLTILALALQSLVVVVLWTRLFDPNVSCPSWQKEIISWSLPAVWVASIVLWQLVFGKRRWIGVTLTTIAACVFSAAVAFSVDAFRPDVIYVPAKMAMGEGGWSNCIGDAEMIVNGKKVAYEVRVGNVVYASLRPINGLILIAKEPLNECGLGLLNHLVVRRDELFAAGPLSVLKLPLLPDPTICQMAVSLEPQGKAETFEKWEMRDVDGMREYDCTLTRWHGKGGRIVLRVPEAFFHSLRRH